MIIALFYSVNSRYYNETLNENYFKSQEFVDSIYSRLSREAKNLLYNQYENREILNNGEKVKVYSPSIYKYGYEEIKDYTFFIQYVPKNKVVTNVSQEYSTTEEIISYINNMSGDKLTIKDGKVTASEQLFEERFEDNKNSLKGNYEDFFEEQKLNDLYNLVSQTLANIEKDSAAKGYYQSTESITDYNSTKGQNKVYVDYNVEDFVIYINYAEEFELDRYDSYIVELLTIIKPYEDIMYASIPFCGIFTILCLIYLIVSIGHKKEKEGIELNDIDKIPLEIVSLIFVLALIGLYLITAYFLENINSYYKLFLSVIITAYFVSYILIAVTVTTIVKRIKAKVLFKNTVIYALCELIEKMILSIKKATDTFMAQIGDIWKILIFSIIYAWFTIFILMYAYLRSEIEIGIIIDAILSIFAIRALMKRTISFNKIKNALKNIYEGNNKERLNEDEMQKSFKDVARYINDISNGFENAVEAGIKSERLKTELITNVSHDIKTPLTSIINYVDLIKRENVDNEKVKEYIEILESKSHRLKKLTEDLVEASKVSSGNIKLTLEKINLVELINQTTGEFEDRFNERNLEIITTMPEEVFIEADSRYMYRIIENLFCNIAKYAQTNSRVYIDVKRDKEIANIEIKNISQEKLNISEDELMQRFVRGDKSRTTEGSGLRTFYIKELNRTTKWSV